MASLHAITKMLWIRQCVTVFTITWLSTDVCGAAVTHAIDFDDLVGGGEEWSGDHYEDFGVIFSSLDGSTLHSIGLNLPDFSDKVIFASSTGGALADSAVVASFVVGVRSVSFEVVDSEDPAGVWEVLFLGADGQTLHQIEGTAGAPGGPPAFVSYELDTFDIFGVVFTPSLDAEGLDDFAFTVPSPGALPVMLGTLMLHSRRQQRESATRSRRL